MAVLTPDAIKTTRPAVTPERTGKSKWLARLAIFLACQVLALLFVETILYCAGMGEEEIFQFDNEIGFVHMHDKRVTWRTEGFAQSYLNSDGMRESGLTLQKPPDTVRVALLGDSMVEGLQVPIEQTFGQVLQQRLSPIQGRRVQFLNFGTSGYSTVQEYLQLQRQVFKYNPDLVICCYDSRDIFENWSPPDQVITNVRPYGLHLPGGKLVIDSFPVRRWMRSPRAQFLIATTWLRHNSRIAGLLSAIDLEWSQHNPWYRAVIDAFSHPKKAVNEIKQAIAGLWSSGPSFKIAFFEDGVRKQSQADRQKPAGAHVFNSATANDALKQNLVLVKDTEKAAGAASPPVQAASIASAAPEQKYVQLISHTLGSLLSGMQAQCAQHNARFAVVALPVRAQLCPLIGMETSFAGVDYSQEVSIVSKICTQNHIPFFDVENLAERLDYPHREKLFYTAHLTPEGQRFIADALQPFVRNLLVSGQ